MTSTNNFKRNLVFSFLLFSIPFFSQAQESAVDFGTVSNEEFQLKECVFDKNADAVILMEKANSYFDEQHHLITERRVRLKILKEKGVERGNIRILFYSDDGFEQIRDIAAAVVTTEENGTIVTKALERKNIFYKKVNRLYSEVSFALPNVKVGSIIDYKYQSFMKSYAGLRNWEFQKELPVITSLYELAPIPNSEFAYTVYKKSDMPIFITPDNDKGKIRFQMNNIPGLRDEVYSPSPKNYLQRVNFQFASYRDYFGKKSYTSTWQEMARELSGSGSFGSQADKNLSGTEFLKTLPLTLPAQEKIKAIYSYVRNNIVWDDVYSKFSENSVKSVLEKKKGNSGDINLLLVSLLKSAGLEAYPMLVSERYHGKVDTAYSYLDQFNKVVAYVLVNNAAYVLDGTDLHTPYFLVPPALLNTIGFRVDKKNFGFVYLNNLPHKQKESIFIQANIGEDGKIEGEAAVNNAEYSKVYSERKYKAGKTSYIESFLKPYPFIKLDSFAVEGINDDSVALTHRLKFHYDLKKAGDYYLLNYNLFTGFDENPFGTQHRFTDIDLGTKYMVTLVGNYLLPPSLKAETIPANKSLVSPDKSLTVSRVMEKAGEQLNMRITITINRESFLPHEYDMVKEFYKEMIALLNEPVLLKAK